MKSDRSYRKSFIFAVVLHVLVITFLFIKLFNVKPPSFVQSSSYIKAVAVDQNDINAQTMRAEAAKKAAQAKKELEQKQQERIEQQRQEQIKQQQEELLAAQEQQREQAIEQKKQLAAALAAEKLQLEQAQRQAAMKAQANALVKKHLLDEQAKEAADLKKQIQKEQAKEVAAHKQEAQQQLMQKMMQDQLADEKQQLSSAQASRAAQGEVDKYKALIIQAISSQWIVPDGVDNNTSCQLLVAVAPGGQVLDVKVAVSSNNEVLEQSAKKAVLKASPLPVPSDPALFDNFRSLKLIVRPEGIT